MDGKFRYINIDGDLIEVYNSGDIPTNAKELILWQPYMKPPPHTPQDHDDIDNASKEFSRIYNMIYLR